jgi:hypothetical protein
MDGEGWEARMAERAKARAVVREAEEIARQDADFQPADFAEPEMFQHWRFERICSEGDDVTVVWLSAEHDWQ